VRIVRGAEVRALYQEGGFEAAQFLRRSKLRVLVAEDVLLNQTILKDLFEANNIAVKIVDDGQQLIEAVMPTLKARARDENEEEQFDLVLTDIYMPNIDGIEAARMIRIQESSLGVGQYGRVPIVALTANAFRDEHVKMIEAGIDEVVTKPLEPMELWKKIREFQDKRRIPLEEQETESGGEGAAVVGPPMGRALTEAGLRQLADRAVLDVLGTSENDFPLLRQYYAMMVTTRGRLVDEDRIEIYEIATEFWRFDDFARRLGGNGEAVQKSLDMFLGSYPEMFHIIERARAVKNEDGLKRAVHSVGGVLAQLGCTVGWYLAREVESNCYFNDWFRMDMLLRELRQVTEVFVRSVQGYLAYYSRSTGRPERSV
jgi:CheY-like chemotaxis protein